jgi:Fe-S oxidoreductase
MVVSEKHPSLETFISENNTNILTACYQCSSCTSVCPLRRVSKFNPRKIIHNALLDKPVNEDDLTSCLTCGKCLEVCPQEIDFPEFIRLARMDMGVSEDNFAHHNIFNLLQLFMIEMTETGMKFDYEGETDSNSKIAYFPGCADLFDKFLDLKETNFHQIGQSAINVMNKAGIKPNLISLKCCGHDAYWTGDLDSYNKVRDYNKQVIQESGISTLVVSCAECYYTLGKLYELEGVKVKHLSQFIEENKDSFEFKGEEGSSLTYHDPCRLGRFMKEYDAPRNVLKNAGVNIKELSLNRQFTNCCGVSAWLKCDDRSRAVMLRKLEEATQAVGDDGTLVVSCNKCYAHLNCVLEDRKPQHNYQIKVKELGMVVDELSTKKS